jgi:8-oxo-dGTP diphosphatase
MAFTIVYAQTPFPTTVVKKLFLAGPTDRRNRLTAWREEALQILKHLDFDGHVFIPESETGEWNGNRDAQFEWEDEALRGADAIVFWVPRDLNTLPGFTTNIEFGLYARSRKIVWAAPEDAQKVDWPERYAEVLNVPITRDLKYALRIAREHIIGSGALREGDDAKLSLQDWKKKLAPVYPHPYCTADCVAINDGAVLLIRRKNEPFKDQWAIPGGFINKDEDPLEAARRELLEETGLEASVLTLVNVFGKGGRDPRGWIISHAYVTLVDTRVVEAKDDAAEVAWLPLKEAQATALAFDHNQILNAALLRLEVNTL